MEHDWGRLGETGGDRGRPTALFRNIHFTVFVLFFVLFSLSSDQISDLIFNANFVKYKNNHLIIFITLKQERELLLVAVSVLLVLILSPCFYI